MKELQRSSKSSERRRSTASPADPSRWSLGHNCPTLGARRDSDGIAEGTGRRQEGKGVLMDREPQLSMEADISPTGVLCGRRAS